MTEFSSNKYHRYNDKKKFKKETNKAIYLLLLDSFKFDFVKKINNAPIVGSKINDEMIGKSILFYN